MATEAMDLASFEPAGASTHPELLVSAVLHLMSHYTVNSPEMQGCTKLAAVIERHLKALAELPDLAPILRATCRQLSEQWETVVERTMQAKEKQSRFLRFVAGAK